MSESLSDLFDDNREFGDALSLVGDDLFALLESLDNVADFPPLTPLDETSASAGGGGAGEEATTRRLVSQKSTSSTTLVHDYPETEFEPCCNSPKSKRAKVASSSQQDQEGRNQDEPQRMSHITVERNRRKQMNDHLSVLRSLMPCFYVKRGDQASIISGVIDYINELQQVLQSLEAKKQRKAYSEVLSPRVPVVSSPRPSPLSPRKPPLSPRINLPISPRTPQPNSPYKPPRLHNQPYLSSPTGMQLDPSPSSSSTSGCSVDGGKELVANSKSALADVEVKFSGPNLVLKTVSGRIPGQAAKIMAALEELALEILHVNINTVDETMLNSFTIKIGIECQLSAEELAQQIQKTFC